MDEKIKVFIKSDAQNRIIAINSSIFLADATGWVQIDEGTGGDKFAHAQNLYFDKPVVDMRGCYNYKLIDCKPVERTEEEKQGDITMNPPEPTEADKLSAKIDYVAMMTEVDISGLV